MINSLNIAQIIIVVATVPETVTEKLADTIPDTVANMVADTITATVAVSF